jgi:hypothetical protein
MADRYGASFEVNVSPAEAQQFGLTHPRGHGSVYHGGDVDKDQEGIQTMQVLGQNMAWLLKKLYG